MYYFEIQNWFAKGKNNSKMFIVYFIISYVIAVIRIYLSAIVLV